MLLLVLLLRGRKTQTGAASAYMSNHSDLQYGISTLPAPFLDFAGLGRGCANLPVCVCVYLCMYVGSAYESCVFVLF